MNKIEQNPNPPYGIKRISIRPGKEKNENGQLEDM